jgi:hypothetical protein
MQYTLNLPYGAPNLNDLNRVQREASYVRGAVAERSKMRRGTPRRVRDRYAEVKGQWATRVWAHVMEQKIPLHAFPEGAHISFLIVEVDMRRDPDNFSTGTAKLVLDGLVRAGVLETDGWKGVRSLSFDWAVGKPCVQVTLSDGKE